MDGRLKFKLRILCMCNAMCVPVRLVEVKLFTYPRADGKVKMKQNFVLRTIVVTYPRADGCVKKVMLVTYPLADDCSYVSARGRLCQNEVTYCNFKRVYAYLLCARGKVT